MSASLSFLLLSPSSSASSSSIFHYFIDIFQNFHFIRCCAEFKGQECVHGCIDVFSMATQFLSQIADASEEWSHASNKLDTESGLVKDTKTGCMFQHTSSAATRLLEGAAQLSCFSQPFYTCLRGTGCLPPDSHPVGHSTTMNLAV